jgi:phosphoglycerol transferase MdoB-like AlkP superfamily enzyme
MPVDMFEEAETESYQPCLPQLLELFNKLKTNTSSSDYHEQQWYPAFFQAVTDGYDRQREFDAKIGFKHVINKEKIKEDSVDHAELEEINYFGFPDTALNTYITDYISNATANNQRMFLSHFTSTTHHPWAVPKWFNTSEYMGTAHGLMQTHTDLNNYLNTVRFDDAWIGQLMQIFDDQGISDETLVILVGDHGQAFKEDFSKTGTYENGHISNFRVPITFRHPKLPRLQHTVNTTSVSVLPTILDLLINSGSLNEKDTAAAADLVQDYEGQSLIRPFRTTHRGRRAWNYSLVNPGGRMLTITSSDTPWRLVLPLDRMTEYVFSDLGRDPMELNRVLEWSIKSLSSTVRGKYGDEAADWLIEAEKIGLWWSSERKRLWKYNPSSER